MLVIVVFVGLMFLVVIGVWFFVMMMRLFVCSEVCVFGFSLVLWKICGIFVSVFLFVFVSCVFVLRVLSWWCFFSLRS